MWATPHCLSSAVLSRHLCAICAQARGGGRETGREVLALHPLGAVSPPGERGTSCAGDHSAASMSELLPGAGTPESGVLLPLSLYSCQQTLRGRYGCYFCFSEEEAKQYLQGIKPARARGRIRTQVQALLNHAVCEGSPTWPLGQQRQHHSGICSKSKPLNQKLWGEARQAA